MEVPPRFESVEGKVHELKKALNGMNETVPKKCVSWDLCDFF